MVFATFSRCRPFCVQRHIAILKPSAFLDVRYGYWAMASPAVFRQAMENATGTAQKTVPLRCLRRILMPLPPHEERQRIVAKVERLMALCDDLEAKLRHADERAAKLVEAVAAEIVS